jgi:hypothetical protein
MLLLMAQQQVRGTALPVARGQVRQQQQQQQQEAGGAKMVSCCRSRVRSVHQRRHVRLLQGLLLAAASRVRRGLAVQQQQEAMGTRVLAVLWVRGCRVQQQMRLVMAA